MFINKHVKTRELDYSMPWKEQIDYKGYKNLTSESHWFVCVRVYIHIKTHRPIVGDHIGFFHNFKK